MTERFAGKEALFLENTRFFELVASGEDREEFKDALKTLTEQR